MDCYDYNACVFHNDLRTPADIPTWLMASSSLGISISTIICYSSYFGLTKSKSNYFCFSLAFGISFHYQFWWMDLGAFVWWCLSCSGISY